MPAVGRLEYFFAGHLKRRLMVLKAIKLSASMQRAGEAVVSVSDVSPVPAHETDVVQPAELGHEDPQEPPEPSSSLAAEESAVENEPSISAEERAAGENGADEAQASSDVGAESSQQPPAAAATEPGDPGNQNLTSDDDFPDFEAAGESSSQPNLESEEQLQPPEGDAASLDVESRGTAQPAESPTPSEDGFADFEGAESNPSPADQPVLEEKDTETEGHRSSPAEAQIADRPPSSSQSAAAQLGDAPQILVASPETAESDRDDGFADFEAAADSPGVGEPASREPEGSDIEQAIREGSGANEAAGSPESEAKLPPASESFGRAVEEPSTASVDSKLAAQVPEVLVTARKVCLQVRCLACITPLVPAKHQSRRIATLLLEVMQESQISPDGSLGGKSDSLQSGLTLPGNLAICVERNVCCATGHSRNSGSRNCLSRAVKGACCSSRPCPGGFCPARPEQLHPLGSCMCRFAGKSCCTQLSRAVPRQQWGRPYTGASLGEALANFHGSRQMEVCYTTASHRMFFLSRLVHV